MLQITPALSHPSVDWQRLERKQGGWHVQVTCPVCEQDRMLPVRTVSQRIRKGAFTGLCRLDWCRKPAATTDSQDSENPSHPAVNWARQEYRKGGSVVSVTCPQCNTERFELAKTVRHRIAAGKFSGRCRRHAQWLRSVSPKDSVLEHPAVDWNVQESQNGECLVRVTCPHCGEVRLDRAKSVRYRLRRGSFTGFCRRDSQREYRLREGLEVRESKEKVVDVVCPICHESRKVNAQVVHRQKRNGTFTGRCRADRLVGERRSNAQPRPDGGGIDWNDVELVRQGSRRRTMVRVHCPNCGRVRLMLPSLVARKLREGNFQPQCTPTCVVA